MQREFVKNFAKLCVKVDKFESIQQVNGPVGDVNFVIFHINIKLTF